MKKFTYPCLNCHGTGWSKEFTRTYLNWMYKEGLIAIVDDMAIDVAIYNSIYIEDKPSAL